MQELIELNERAYWAAEALICTVKIAYLKIKIAYYDWRLS